MRQQQPRAAPAMPTMDASVLMTCETRDRGRGGTTMRCRELRSARLSRRHSAGRQRRLLGFAIMPSLSHRQRRRSEFLRLIDGPVLLMAGGARARNYPDNVYPFRADGSFLFFFAAPEPEAAALFDPADGSVTLFLHERTPEAALWHGPVPDFAAMQAQHGVTE